ncbi:MAG: EVE domain-containing protein [bacterium]|nr:ubiquinol-cytochrome C reductase [Deltaproteobacteria bacterium]MCP4904931.1 EVE domain-containing protein [bacterium]
MIKAVDAGGAWGLPFAGGSFVARAYWLMKSEPNKYSWDQLVEDGRTYWDGVRNHEARNHLAAMKMGDLALYYHSNVGKEVVGIVEIVGEAYPDPTADDPRWVVVDVAPLVPFSQPVTLATIKADPKLPEIALVRRGRLSVVSLTSAEFRHVAKLGKTKVPAVKKAVA